MIERHIQSFSSLRSDTKRSHWTAATKFRAPHKPLLLLAVIDLIAQGIINTNFIEFTPDLGELFTIYWSRVMPPDQRSNIVLPFYHLSSDKFWQHIPKPGMEVVLATIGGKRVPAADYPMKWVGPKDGWKDRSGRGNKPQPEAWAPRARPGRSRY